MGGEDKRQSEGETTQQYVHRQYWGMYTLNVAKALVMAGLLAAHLTLTVLIKDVADIRNIESCFCMSVRDYVVYAAL